MKGISLNFSFLKWLWFQISLSYFSNCVLIWCVSREPSTYRNRRLVFVLISHLFKQMNLEWIFDDKTLSLYSLRPVHQCSVELEGSKLYDPYSHFQHVVTSIYQCGVESERKIGIKTQHNRDDHQFVWHLHLPPESTQTQTEPSQVLKSVWNLPKVMLRIKQL